MFSDAFIKQVHTCDTMFTNIDTRGDNVLHQDEFEAYVRKTNKDQSDFDHIMKEFNLIDSNHDGLIQFDEFLRALCLKGNIYMKPELDVYDRLQIAEMVEYRHISASEKVELLKAIENCRASVIAEKPTQATGGSES